MANRLTVNVSVSRWVRCNTERIYPKVEYWVTELLQGCEYEFRVSAENVVGAGDPSPPSKPVFAKDPIGKFSSCNNTSFHCYYCINSLQEFLPVLCHSETQSTSEPPRHRLHQGVSDSVLAAAHRHWQRKDLWIPAGVPEGWRGRVVQGEAVVQLPGNVNFIYMEFAAQRIYPFDFNDLCTAFS